jgi:hypothetical protein
MDAPARSLSRRLSQPSSRRGCLLVLGVMLLLGLGMLIYTLLRWEQVSAYMVDTMSTHLALKLEGLSQKEKVAVKRELAAALSELFLEQQVLNSPEGQRLWREFRVALQRPRWTAEETADFMKVVRAFNARHGLAPAGAEAEPPAN